MARISSFAVRSSGDYDASGNKADEDKKDLWSSMLDGASSGKKLPQKTVFVLGELAVMAGFVCPATTSYVPFLLFEGP